MLLEILNNAGSLFALTLTTVIFVFFTDNYLILSVIFGIYLLIHFIVSYQDIKQIVELYKNRKNK